MPAQHAQAYRRTPAARSIRTGKRASGVPLHQQQEEPCRCRMLSDSKRITGASEGVLIRHPAQSC
ncbi:hypothetical protein DSC45_34255 [Streptomyces sp. YIM 130001]|nr:hypothetical protein DSC45_34255 [Streptomyces sp. YIM 130001]